MLLAPEVLYATMLGLDADWVVSRVEVDHSILEVHVYLEYTKRDALAPGLTDRLSIYDWREERMWRHLDSMHYKTFVHARLPRVRRPDGKIVTVSVPWAEASERRTWLFEAWSIQMLRGSKNQTQAAGLLRLSFDELHRIMERAVERGLLRREADLHVDGSSIDRLSIDEKAYRRGRRFITVVSDPKGGRILEVAEGRSLEAAQSALHSALAPHLLEQVRTVTVDMAPAYRQAVELTLPNATVVYDKFHVIKHVTEAIDQVRRQEVQTQPLLKNTRFLWLTKLENQMEAQRKKMDQLFEQIDVLALRTAQAWKVRESFSMMYLAQSREQARDFFYRWKDSALKTGLTPVRKVVHLLERHLAGILNYFPDKATSAMAERLNGKIQELKVIGKGYRTVPQLRIAILFFFGNLDLLPHNTQ